MAASDRPARPGAHTSAPSRDETIDLTDAETRPLTEVVGDLANDVGELVSAQIKLATTEVREEIAAARSAAMWFGAAGVTAFIAVLLVAFAAAWGLAEVVAPGWAFLIVGAAIAVLAAVLFFAGRSAASSIQVPPPVTKQTLEEDRQWLAQQMR